MSSETKALAAAAEPSVPAVSDEERDAIAAQAREDAEYARARTVGRRNSYMVKVEGGEEGGLRIGPSDLTGGLEADVIRKLDTFGTRSVDFASERMRDLAAIAGRRGSARGAEQAINAALAFVGGVEPENETEALLATQMVATHESAMRMLAKATGSGDRQTMQECGTLATKLLRTYTAQMETLARIRRRGEQKVRVEHVHVYPGGQAIVGDVTTGLPLPGIGTETA